MKVPSSTSKDTAAIERWALSAELASGCWTESGNKLRWFITWHEFIRKWHHCLIFYCLHHHRPLTHSFIIDSLRLFDVHRQGLSFILFPHRPANELSAVHHFNIASPMRQFSYPFFSISSNVPVNCSCYSSNICRFFQFNPHTISKIYVSRAPEGPDLLYGRLIAHVSFQERRPLTTHFRDMTIIINW